MSNDEKPVRRPGSWDEMYPNRFLKAGLLKGKPATLTIADVTIELLPSDKGPDQDRGILSFEKTNKQLALNKTNGLCLRKMFGNKPLEWIGKRVTFVPELDKFGSETVDAIRIQGSPDIAKAIEIEIRMPRKKPKKRRLVVTGKAQAPAPQSDAMPDITDDQASSHEPDFSDTEQEAAAQTELDHLMGWKKEEAAQ